MKKLSEIIGLLFTLYIVGMIIYGGFKEGYIWQTILIIGGIVFALYLFGVREDNLNKIKQNKIEKEHLKKLDELFESVKYSIYVFAHDNERITEITYDIEEGGDYLTEFERTTRDIIDSIIKSYIDLPKYRFERSIPKIHKAILELPKQPKKDYIGF